MPSGKPISDEIKAKIYQLFLAESVSTLSIANRFGLNKCTVSKLLTQFKKEKNNVKDSPNN